MSWQEPGVVGIVGDQPAVVWVSQVRGETGGRILKIVLTFLKKCTTSELKLTFYLVQNEDCSPGDSTSESSERLLQRGKGKVSVFVILRKGWVVHAIKHIFLH